MTSNQNQRTLGEIVRTIAALIGLTIGVFTLLAIFLPTGLVQPIGALVTGLVFTIILVMMRKVDRGTAFASWFAISIVLIIVYLIVSRPATAVGSITDSGGSPVVGLTLVLTDSSGVEHKTVTDEQGAFEIKNIPEGRFTILANGKLLFSGHVPSGWMRITAPQVPVGGIAIVPTSTNTPPPTETPSPTFTPTETSTLTPTVTLTPTSILTTTTILTATPIACGPVTNPGCLTYVSPQLAEISSAVSFLFTNQPENFIAEYTDEAFNSEPISIKIMYKAVSPNYGGWGIGGLPGYDVSGFERVSFYLKGTAIGQTFEFKLKDTDLREDRVLVTVGTLDWTEVSFTLDKSNFPTVNFASLENINLGFNDGLGSATIYVDDFAFLP